MAYTRERIGKLLLDFGLITEDQLQIALDEQAVEGSKLGEVLVRGLVLSENQLATTLASQKGLEAVDLSAIEIDRAATVLLPLTWLQRTKSLPIRVDGDRLVLAMADPLDVETMDDAAFQTGMKVVPVVAPAGQIRLATEKFVAGNSALLELESAVPDDVVQSDLERNLTADSNVAVVRIIDQAIREAILEKASDIHFEPCDGGVRVRYRVDGVLRQAMMLPKTSQAELTSRLKIMAEMDITERRRPQDGRISVKFDNNVISLRAATLPTPAGEAITLRILDTGVSFHSLDDMGLAEDDLVRVRRMQSRPYGILFVSGPTGSGKSTTLYALLNEVGDVSKNVITVEDPIEYRMDDLTQVAVNPRAGLTFASALRSILRSDPDIVMIGEVRDPETAEIAVRAALTGHLVLTSVHTNDAPSALTRLNDMGVPPYITSSALLGVVAQRLVRKLCQSCKRPIEYTPAELLADGFTEEEIPSVITYEAVGCQLCTRTGYLGRTGVFEVLEFDDELQTMFLHNASSRELREEAIARGMRTLRRDALNKVKAGVTSLSEVNRVVGH